MPVATAFVVLPGVMLAFLPPPIVWMDDYAGGGRIDVRLRRMPAVAIAIADDARRSAKRRHADEGEPCGTQKDEFRAGIHRCSWTIDDPKRGREPEGSRGRREARPKTEADRARPAIRTRPGRRP